MTGLMQQVIHKMCNNLNHSRIIPSPKAQKIAFTSDIKKPIVLSTRLSGLRYSHTCLGIN